MDNKFPLSLEQVCAEGARVALCAEGPKTCLIGCCCFPCTMNEIDGNPFSECSARCCLRSSDNAQAWVMDQWQAPDKDRAWSTEPVVQPGLCTCILGSCCTQCLAAKIAKEIHTMPKAPVITRQPVAAGAALLL